MLNEPLYNALGKIVTGLSVVKEDEHAEIFPKGNTYEWELGETGIAQRGQQFKANCPFCGDRRGRLYISYLSFSRPMLNGVAGAPAGLIGVCFNEQCLQEPNNFDTLRCAIEDALGGKAIPIIPAIRQGDDDAPKDAPSSENTLDGIRSWVPDYKPLEECTNSMLLGYLAHRGVTSEDVIANKIGFGKIKVSDKDVYLGNGADYILFPWLENERVVGIQGRLPDYAYPGWGSSWWISPKCRKTVTVYNIDNAIACNCAVVTEGVFDAIAVGRPGVAVFGYAPSKLQLQKLANVGGVLIWIPDNFCKKKVDKPLQYAERATKELDDVFRFGAHVVRLPQTYKDCGEMPRGIIWETIMASLRGPARDHVYKNVLPKVWS
jgi:hypothetical protein